MVYQSSFDHREVGLRHCRNASIGIRGIITEKILANRDDIGTLLELDQHLLGLHSSGWVLQRKKEEQRSDERKKHNVRHLSVSAEGLR